MKITFVIPSLKTGGGNRVFIELSNILSEDHDVTLIAPSNSKQKHTFRTVPGVRTLSIGTPSENNMVRLVNVYKTIRYINKKCSDSTVIITDPIFSAFSHMIRVDKLYRFIQADDYRIFDDGRILGKGLILKMYKKFTLKSFRNKHVNFIYCSSFVYDAFSRFSKRTDVPFVLVQPAIGHMFQASGRIYSKDKLTVCLVGRRHPLKGLPTFINMWRSLDPAYKSMVGQITIASPEDLSMFDTAGMTVITPRSDEEMAEFYRSADIFVSTSWLEGFSLPTLEAMACGCACIISDSGGVNDYVVHGDNALLFEPRNEEQLAEHMIRMLLDKELRIKLIESGMETASRFNWDNSAAQLMKAISTDSRV